MDRVCIIRQPAGLGDIIFTQKIAQTIIKENLASRIIWPVIKEYTYITSYMESEEITYINENEFFPYKKTYLSNPKQIIDTKDLLYIPLQAADSIIRDCPIMQAKYKLCNIDYHDWKDYFHFKRNKERESFLENYLNIKEPFTLVNNNFGSKDYAYLKNNRGISIEGNCIYMEYLDFDNIFDWVGILEKADDIHTVDTVWCYFMEKLGIEKATVYSRNHDPNFFKYVVGIFNPKWVYIL